MMRQQPQPIASPAQQQPTDLQTKPHRRSLPWGFWVAPVLLVLTFLLCLFFDLNTLRIMSSHPDTDAGGLSWAANVIIAVFALTPLTIITLALAIVALSSYRQVPLWQRLLLLFFPLIIGIGVIVRWALSPVLVSLVTVLVV